MSSIVKLSIQKLMTKFIRIISQRSSSLVWRSCILVLLLFFTILRYKQIIRVTQKVKGQNLKEERCC